MMKKQNIVHVKTDDIYKDIAENVKTKFGTSNCELNKPLPKQNKKNVICVSEDDLGGNIVK